MNLFFITQPIIRFATSAAKWAAHLSLPLLVAGLATNTAAPSHADIVMSVTGHFRQIIGQAFTNVDVEDTTLNGAFDESVSESFVLTNLTLNSSASQLSQTPSLIGESITGSGSVAYDATVSSPVGSLFARSDSFFTAQFTVDATEEYLLSSFVEWNGTLPPGGGPENNRSIVTLQQNFPPQQLVKVLRDSVNQGSLNADQQVLLEQGRNYTLTVHAQTFGGVGSVASGSFSATANWEIHLTAMPELGDVNLDGVVNLLDVDPFIDRIITGVYQAEADTNQDGLVNLLDVDPFVALLIGE